MLAWADRSIHPTHTPHTGDRYTNIQTKTHTHTLSLYSTWWYVMTHITNITILSFPLISLCLFIHLSPLPADSTQHHYSVFLLRSHLFKFLQFPSCQESQTSLVDSWEKTLTDITLELMKQVLIVFRTEKHFIKILWAVNWICLHYIVCFWACYLPHPPSICFNDCPPPPPPPRPPSPSCYHDDHRCVLSQRGGAGLTRKLWVTVLFLELWGPRV